MRDGESGKMSSPFGVFLVFSLKRFEHKPRHQSKIWIFWSNPYEIEVIITSLIEMLEMPNSDSVIIFIVDIIYKNYYFITFFSKYLYFKEAGVANFVEIIKISVMLIKATRKDSIKIKRFRENESKCNFYLYFPI